MIGRLVRFFGDAAALAAMIRRLVHFFGDPEHARRRRWLLAAALLAVLMSNLFVSRDHAEFFWEDFFGWSTLFGFVACVAIIFVSKVLGHLGGLMRREDYYD